MHRRKDFFCRALTFIFFCKIRYGAKPLPGAKIGSYGSFWVQKTSKRQETEGFFHRNLDFHKFALPMKALEVLLEEAVCRYNTVAFIEGDPICVPHRFQRLQDREIAGFWAATLAWGQRKAIVQSALRAMELMDWAPYDFVCGHSESDRRRFERYYHRTFQATDALYFLSFFQAYYRKHGSLETAFAQYLLPDDLTVERALVGFHRLFFSLPWVPERTRKHVATPERGATCKRLNMFLRWMVRRDDAGVDFGLWRRIRPSQLLLPLDVHVERVARRLGLLQRRQTDWKAVLELTDKLRTFDPDDPAKYDFALFGLSMHSNDR